MENERVDRFKDAMGILIAGVALVTALAAWRASTAARTAGVEDYRAVVSVLNAEDTRTLNFASALAHLTAFTQFVINDELLTQLSNAPADAANDAQIEETDRLAATNRNFFPARYANQDGTYDVQREVAEQFAQAERQQDLSPDGHLAEAAMLDNKTFAFIQTIILSSVALLFFTLASAWHEQQRVLRYSTAALGIVLLVISIVQIVATEFS
jgi:hypothetical protein